MGIPLLRGNQATRQVILVHTVLAEAHCAQERRLLIELVAPVVFIVKKWLRRREHDPLGVLEFFLWVTHQTRVLERFWPILNGGFPAATHL